MTVNYRDEMHKVMNNGFNVRDDLKNKSVEELNSIQPKNGFAVCAMNLFGDLNTANIIRSSVIFGADKVFLAGRSNFDRRGSVGAQNYMKIVKLNYLLDDMTIDWHKIISEIVSDGYCPFFVEVGGYDVNHFFKSEAYKDIEIFFKNGPCFIFGNEGLGIPQEVLDFYSEEYYIVSIPQCGIMRSLNVSVAAGIVMNAWVSK